MVARSAAEQAAIVHSPVEPSAAGTVAAVSARDTVAIATVVDAVAVVVDLSGAYAVLYADLKTAGSPVGKSLTVVAFACFALFVDSALVDSAPVAAGPMSGCSPRDLRQADLTKPAGLELAVETLVIMEPRSRCLHRWNNPQQEPLVARKRCQPDSFANRHCKSDNFLRDR